jgi:hypothetical protein
MKFRCGKNDDTELCFLQSDGSVSVALFLRDPCDDGLVVTQYGVLSCVSTKKKKKKKKKSICDERSKMNFN